MDRAVSQTLTPRTGTGAKPRFLVVLQYHFTRYTGGAEMQSWMLATELARRGWDVHFASATAALPAPTMEGVTLHALPERPPQWRGNRAAVADLLRELAPDVVYSRIFDPYLGWVALGAPPHTLRIFATASRFDGRPWPILALGRRGAPWPQYLRRLPGFLYGNYIARQGRKRAHLVLAQHRDQQEDLARIGIRAELLRNSHPPVGAEEVQAHAGTPLVLWADSIKPLKRPEVFLELARRLRDVPARFLMLGSIYDKSYEEPIARAVRELPNFEYGGFIPLADVGQYFRAAHLHVKTSLPIEGFPNTFVQSWIRGVPVASLEIDLEGILARGELGVRAATMDELEAAVRELVLDPERRRAMGARAREFALREFDLRANVDRLERLLAERGVKLPAR